MKNRKGYLVQHSDGRKAIAYYGDQRTDMIIYAVYIVDDNYKTTGEKAIWGISKVRVIGFVD